MKNFWLKLKKPIYALAPMAGITDSAFRQICKDFGADVVYSEMASVTALTYNPGKTLEMLKFSPKERPYVVQVFGSNPEHFAKAVKLVEKKIKPDGIDINFGCPVPKVSRQKAGAELFKDLKLSRQVLKTVTLNTSLPVSIKTRARVGSVDILEFLKNVSDLDIKAIMIHGRSFSQGFSGSIDWQIIKKSREYFSGIILANGGVGLNLTPNPSPRQERGVKDYCDWLLNKTGADGVGVGQGALGRPWIFGELKAKSEKGKTKEEIFNIILKHTKLVCKLKGRQGIIEMRKHLCWYVQGLSGARKLREKLVKIESLDDINKILK
ncbi:MAG: tRNA-dihydrouridine synthase [Patescibacteria group bacterium]|nr:tRNA-dihydrouridine synthase [Patescibacteria group bacterium]MDD5295235.1 tRNA-dihydrouridine synthase [Patescibacteria group bacterium]MDD5554780.1 tRNA-dihydrouridine synthase [Patescibacteria group bacterium]